MRGELKIMNLKAIQNISKDNPNRWFYISNDVSTIEGLVLCGYVGVIGVSQLATGEPNILSFVSEEDLETYVNTLSGIADYYEQLVLHDSDKFQEPSTIYEPLPPP
jgi:hypothetical protein